MSEVSSLLELGANMEFHDEVKKIDVQLKLSAKVSLQSLCNLRTSKCSLYFFTDPMQWGMTALYVASMYGHYEIVKILLLQAGADPNIQNEVSNLKW